MDRAITASKANQRFSETLCDVAEGESFTVTSRGRPVARVTPVDRALEQGLVEKLLRFSETLPARRSRNWIRANLYE